MTGDVHLRDVVHEDLPILFKHQLDPAATDMAQFPSRDRASFMAHWARLLGDDTVVTKTILVGDQVAGNIGSWEQDGERLVGYWIGREYWGKGVATLALAQFVAQVRTRPLYAHVSKSNIASRRVLEKCGFAPVGEDDEELVLRLNGAPAGDAT
ncbi:MAG: GNAT family N-acetyltransferase [Anaerolineae bacterium]